MFEKMGIYDAIRASNGVVGFLNRNKDRLDIGKPNGKTHRAQDEHLNNILIKFGKTHNCIMKKNNSPKYKGNYSPFMSNCQTVQEHWDLFEKWIFENYSK